MYGPTEGTGGATIERLLPGLPVTIGKPNPSSRIYILDSRKTLANPGVIGEIYLAGVQIARGYLGRPAETEAVFQQDSTWPSLGEQMYRTGDRGYWNADG
jgi:non-ribosomal peptide synthetase component F